MNCKNCQNSLNKQDLYCNNCGGKVIEKKITFKQLFKEVIENVFGLDNKFFLTLRMMIAHPDIVIKEYLEGVRKRYMNPFAFLAVSAGISLLAFNYFADDFIAINASFQTEETKELERKASIDLSKYKDASKDIQQKLALEKKLAQANLDLAKGMLNFMLVYFNLLTFIFLLIYAVLSKWTFWKPHNFGEHTVINAYAYSITNYIMLICFFLAMFTNPILYSYSLILSLFYYIYVFAKLYKLSFVMNILKLGRFFIGLVLLCITGLILIGIVFLALNKLGILKLSS